VMPAERDAAGKDIVVVWKVVSSAVTLHAPTVPDAQSTVKCLFNHQKLFPSNESRDNRCAHASDLLQNTISQRFGDRDMECIRTLDQSNRRREIANSGRRSRCIARKQVCSNAVRNLNKKHTSAMRKVEKPDSTTHSGLISRNRRARINVEKTERVG